MTSTEPASSRVWAGEGGCMGLEDSKLLEEIIKALESEGGEASLDRLLYAYMRLKEAGREKVLEAAVKSEMIEVSEETLYRHEPNLSRYILLRLVDRIVLQDHVAKKSTVDVEPARRRAPEHG